MSDKDYAEKGADLPTDKSRAGESCVLDEVAGLLDESGHSASMPERVLLDEEFVFDSKPIGDSANELMSHVETETPENEAAEASAEEQDEVQPEKVSSVIQQPTIHHVKPSKIPAIMSSLALLVSLGIAGGLGYERYMLVQDVEADTTQLDEATSAVVKLTATVESLHGEVSSLATANEELAAQIQELHIQYTTEIQNYLKVSDVEAQLDKYKVVTDIKEVESSFQESLLASLELASSQSSQILSDSQSSTKEWVTKEVDAKVDYMLDHVSEVVAGVKLDNDRYQRINSTLKARVDSLEKYLIELNAKNISEKKPK